MTIQIGDPITELTVLQPDRTSINLSAYLGKPLLIIFLRHLA
jgi:peroxiredoxin